MERVRTYGFRDNFIEKLAELVLEGTTGNDLSRTCVVFGGKRPQLFLRKELSVRLRKAFFPPRCFSMDDFVHYICAGREPRRQADPLHACFLLYSLAKERLPELLKNRASFSRFLAWAREIMNFIDQLDIEDIPEGKLKEIEISASIGYEVPESVNTLLRNINLLRTEFHRALEKQGYLTRGMAYREAARAAAKEAFDAFDRIIFCNFFFLHAAERSILKELYGRGKAILVFQRDGRDWSVLERMERDLGIRIAGKVEESAAAEGPEIRLYAAFDTHSQVSCVRSILKASPPNQKTVIVLPDPDALIPLLSEIADCSGEFNVSLGYPVTRSSLYSLFKLVFQAQSSRNSQGYYARDYLKVLGHPLVKNLCLLPGSDPSVTRVLCHKVEELLTGMADSQLAGKLFIGTEEIEACGPLLGLTRQTLSGMELDAPEKELAGILALLHRLLFKAWEGIGNFSGFCAAARELLTLIVNKSPVESYPINLLVCEKMFEMLSLLERGDFDRERFGREEIFRIFLNDLERRSVSFSGSPLKGLQVLGLFETRCLNFDNVIVLDLNEQCLPNLSIYEPLIPREIMLGLGLNRIEKEDEIQRYQFFRLIGGAKTCHLIFSASPDKERSRFLEELLWERQKVNGSLETPIPRTAFPVSIQPEKKTAGKNGEMVSFLRQKLYSASSLNTYLQCPMRFYFQYVLGLREKTDLLDETEAADIGTFCHELLEEAFTPFIGKKPVIDAGFRKKFDTLFEQRFHSTFERTMRSDAFMLKELLGLRLRRFLDRESVRDVKELICLEREQRQEVTLTTGSFAFTYRIDRIDRLEDGSLLVVDYKTGGADLKPASAAKIREKGLDRRQLKKTLKSFQLPMYLYFTGLHFPGEPINACLYSLRSASMTLLLKEAGTKEAESSHLVFLDCLQSILSELTDPDVPFTADQESPQYCDHCPFTRLCR